MAEAPTAREFSQHVNTKFRVKLDAPQPIDLELIEVKLYECKPNEADDMERFSVYFYGAADFFLPQATYPLNHKAMGELSVFLVPIARDERGFRYEAVFNYRRV